MTLHQRKQQEVINEIEGQVNSNLLDFTTVLPVEDFVKDRRICLTSVHLLSKGLVLKIQKQIIEPLKKIEPDIYFYPSECLHTTIKNIRIVNYPPHFDEADIKKAEKIFSEIIPRHKQFKVYFYRLLLFPNNLALMGTTDPELDKIVFDLDRALSAEGIGDDKVYANWRYFFCNITLARFNAVPSEEFRHKVRELSNSFVFQPYTVDSVALVTCSAVFNNRKIRGQWNLVRRGRI